MILLGGWCVWGGSYKMEGFAVGRLLIFHQLPSVHAPTSASLQSQRFILTCSTLNTGGASKIIATRQYHIFRFKKMHLSLLILYFSSANQQGVKLAKTP